LLGNNGASVRRFFLRFADLCNASLAYQRISPNRIVP
jgi:hypothetical protein